MDAWPPSGPTRARAGLPACPCPAAPALARRWTGRVGETKRFVSTLVDQLTVQQAAFQRRILTVLQAVQDGAGVGGGSGHKAGGLQADGQGPATRRGAPGQKGGGAMGGMPGRGGSIGPNNVLKAAAAAAAMEGVGGDDEMNDEMLEAVQALTDTVAQVGGSDRRRRGGSVGSPSAASPSRPCLAAASPHSRARCCCSRPAPVLFTCVVM